MMRELLSKELTIEKVADKMNCRERKYEPINEDRLGVVVGKKKNLIKVVGIIDFFHLQLTWFWQIWPHRFHTQISPFHLSFSVSASNPYVLTPTTPVTKEIPSPTHQALCPLFISLINLSVHKLWTRPYYRHTLLHSKLSSLQHTSQSRKWYCLLLRKKEHNRSPRFLRFRGQSMDLGCCLRFREAGLRKSINNVWFYKKKSSEKWRNTRGRRLIQKVC